MGGEGSGRKPSEKTIVKRMTSEITPIGDSIFIPNYSGVQDAALKIASPLSSVDSVFTRTGDVVAAVNDYTWAQINKTASDIADVTTKSHASLSDIGTNTHAQIDTHMASGSIHFSKPVIIGDGGTGQTTQTAAFDALTPTTTKGDIIVENGTNAVRLAVGTNNNILTADSTAATGIKWAAGTAKTIFSNVNLQTTITDDTTRYISISGKASLETAIEAHHKARMPVAGTWKNVYCNVTDNTIDTDSTGRTRISGANGNITWTIPSSTTGWFSDTTNTDSISAGNDINYVVTTGLGGTSMLVKTMTSEYDT